MRPNTPATQELGLAGDQTSAEPWRRKLWRWLLAIFCLELGLFLLVFPWTHYWVRNYFSNLTSNWRHFWLSPYFRGALSGLGVINLGISFAEVLALRKNAAAPKERCSPN